MVSFLSPPTASRIRGRVAGIPFDQFHKYSAEIVRAGVFGKDADGKIRKELVFPANNLVGGTLTKLSQKGQWVQIFANWQKFTITNNSTYAIVQSVLLLCPYVCVQ